MQHNDCEIYNRQGQIEKESAVVWTDSHLPGVVHGVQMNLHQSVLAEEISRIDRDATDVTWIAFFDTMQVRVKTKTRTCRVLGRIESNVDIDLSCISRLAPFKHERVWCKVDSHFFHVHSVAILRLEG